MSYDTNDLKWNKTATGYALHLGRSRKALVEVVPDTKWPGIMWRVRKADGTLTDVVNLSRAKDAALSIALATLNGRKSPSDRDGGKNDFRYGGIVLDARIGSARHCS
jgi:hypothetical protein